MTLTCSKVHLQIQYLVRSRLPASGNTADVSLKKSPKIQKTFCIFPTTKDHKTIISKKKKLPRRPCETSRALSIICYMKRNLLTLITKSRGESAQGLEEQGELSPTPYPLSTVVGQDLLQGILFILWSHHYGDSVVPSNNIS